VSDADAFAERVFGSVLSTAFDVWRFYRLRG
jgi:hypothetical protein